MMRQILKQGWNTRVNSVETETKDIVCLNGLMLAFTINTCKIGENNRIYLTLSKGSLDNHSAQTVDRHNFIAYWACANHPSKLGKLLFIQHT